MSNRVYSKGGMSYTAISMCRYTQASFDLATSNNNYSEATAAWAVQGHLVPSICTQTASPCYHSFTAIVGARSKLVCICLLVLQSRLLLQQRPIQCGPHLNQVSQISLLFVITQTRLSLVQSHIFLWQLQ